MLLIKNIRNVLLKNNKKNLKFFILFLIFLFIFLLLLFFSGASLDFNIPYGDNAHKIWKIRLEIIFKNIISACAIGASNYLIQLFTRNKLADTSVMGINTFQQLIVAFLILLTPTFFLNYSQTYIFTFIYLVTAIVSGIIYYFISINTYLSSRRILVYGILLNIVVTAIAYFLLTSNAINPDVVKSRFGYYQQKVFGGIKLSSDLSDLYSCFILLVICLIWIFCIRLKIISQGLNPFKINSLGLKNNKIRFQLIMLISILGCIIFSIVGFIAFIGVSISFIVSNLFTGFNSNIFGSMLVSAIIMLLSQFLQISFSYIGTISLTLIVGIISFPIFISFIMLKEK